MMNFLVALAYLIGVLSLVILVVIFLVRNKALRDIWHQMRPRSRWRVAGLLVGIAFIVNGLVFYDFSSFEWDVLSGFLLLMGIQIVLFVIGIRLELLGNTE